MAVARKQSARVLLGQRSLARNTGALSKQLRAERIVWSRDGRGVTFRVPRHVATVTIAAHPASSSEIAPKRARQPSWTTIASRSMVQVSGTRVGAPQTAQLAKLKAAGVRSRCVCSVMASSITVKLSITADQRALHCQPAVSRWASTRPRSARRRNKRPRPSGVIGGSGASGAPGDHDASGPVGPPVAAPGPPPFLLFYPPVYRLGQKG